MIKIICLTLMKIKVKVIQGQPFAEEVCLLMVIIGKKCFASLNNGVKAVKTFVLSEHFAIVVAMVNIVLQTILT